MFSFCPNLWQPVVDTQLGGTNDLTLVSGVQYAGSTLVSFTRSWSGTGGSDVAIINGSQYLLIASAAQDGYEYSPRLDRSGMNCVSSHVFLFFYQHWHLIVL